MKILYEKEIRAGEIVVSPRPVWKCRTCPSYGKNASCPPGVPAWQEARHWIERFSRALFIKFNIDKNSFQQDKRESLLYLLEKERDFFKQNFLYACALFPGSCNICDQCAVETGQECLYPEKVRPSVDALGIELSALTLIDFQESVLYGLVMID